MVGSGTPVTNPVPLNKIVETKAPGYFTQLNNYFAQQVGVNVSIPILNGGILRTNYARSKLNLRNQELQREGDNLTLKNLISTRPTSWLSLHWKNSRRRRSPWPRPKKSFDSMHKSDTMSA